MTLEQLRIFVAAAQLEHITQASVRLNLTQAAVSASIATLEAQYSVKLFDRVGRNISLTTAGRLFLTEARDVLARSAAAQAVLRDYAGLTHGHLSVAASQTLASYYLPAVMVAFQALHPNFRIDLRIGNTAQVVNDVTAGDVELGFIEGPLSAPTLHIAPIATERMIVVVGPTHEWATGHPLSDADLRSGNWIFRESGSGSREAFLAALAQRGIEEMDLTIALTLPSNESVREAVAHGAGAACLSPLVCERALQAGALVQANAQLPPRLFQAVRHKDRYAAQAVLAFLALAQKT